METTQAVNPVEYVYLHSRRPSFIVGLRLLGSPKTARLGNRISALGMLGAVVGVLTQGVVAWWVIIIGIVIGAVIGVSAARAVKMTAMPQMVAIFNGCGGGAAALRWPWANYSST